MKTLQKNLFRNCQVYLPKLLYCFFCGLLLVALVLLLLLVCSPIGLAEEFTLYSSVGVNDTNTKNLIAIYQNSPNYDPFYEFEVARVGQYDYRIFFGRDLDSGEYEYFQYYGIPDGYNVHYYYGGGVGSNLLLNKNGYITVGNVQNSLKSNDAESYKFQYTVLAILFFITILFGFHIFRVKIRARSASRGWQY